MKTKFYENGEIMHYTLPDSFKKSTTKSACGNCGMYSNRRMYCGIWNAPAVKDNYVCHKWRMRFFKR